MAQWLPLQTRLRGHGLDTVLPCQILGKYFHFPLIQFTEANFFMNVYLAITSGGYLTFCVRTDFPL